MMTEYTKHVGLLGGSFNPIHLGHLHLAQELLKARNLDEVWFIPAYINPHKQGKDILAVKHRLRMVELAIETFPSFKINDLECKVERPSYTIDTLRSLKKTHPSVEFSLLLGSDVVKRFDEWKDPEEILKLCRLVVAYREEKPVIPKFESIAINQSIKDGLTQIPILEVSSTEIRSMISRGEDPSQLLPKKVHDYIKKHNLYRLV